MRAKWRTLLALAQLAAMGGATLPGLVMAATPLTEIAREGDRYVLVRRSIAEVDNWFRNLTVTAPNGDVVRTGDHPGKVILINVTDLSAPDFLPQLAAVAQLREKLASDRVLVINISLPEGAHPGEAAKGLASPAFIVSQTPMEYQDKRLFSAYPVVWVFDAQGVLRYRLLGWGTDIDRAEIVDKLHALLPAP